MNSLGATTTYRIAFFPETYVKSMVLHLKLPEQIAFADETEADGVECKSLSSNVASSIKCELAEDEETTVVISDAFNTHFYDSSKGILFSIAGLKNPSTLTTVDSFEIETLTEDGYAIDSRKTDLIINFECMLPCKTCIDGFNDRCASCFTDGTISTKAILVEDLCIDTCPVNQVAVLGELANAPDAKTCVSCFDARCDRCSGPD